MLTQKEIKEILKCTGFLSTEDLNNNNIEEYCRPERIENVIKTYAVKR